MWGPETSTQRGPPRWRGPDVRGTRSSHVRARKTRERRANTLGARTHARNVARERMVAAKGPYRNTGKDRRRCG